MKDLAERLKDNTKVAANRVKKNLLNQQTDKVIKFYESLDEEDFRQLSSEYGLERTAKFIRAMEYKKTGGGE